MGTIAASGDTWGIDGPSFLLAYVVIAAAVWVVGTRVRRTIADGRPHRPVGDLTGHPHDIAYLNGGPELAVYSALASMHLEGTIAPERGSVRAVGRQDGADGLERAIHFTAAVPVDRKRLQFHRPVVDALAEIDARLVESGLLLSADQRRRVRGVGWWMVGVAGLGLLRLLAGVAEAKPVGFLAVALFAVAVVAVVQLSRTPRRTRLGDRTLADLQRRAPRPGPVDEAGLDDLRAGGCRAGRRGVRDERAVGVRPGLRRRDRRPEGDGGRRLLRRRLGRRGWRRRRRWRWLRRWRRRLRWLMAPAAGSRGSPPPDRATACAGPGSVGDPRSPGSIADLPGLGFCEVVAESLVPAAPPRGVAELRERGVAVVPHGVRLSLGGAEPVDGHRITHLAACARAVGAPLVSEHVAFVRAGGRDAGHLLPVPRTREALDVLTANVLRTRAELDVPLALEPIAALFDWPDDELTEGEFLTELLDRTGALLLLDVANVHANAVNRGTDPDAALDALPLDRVAYVHVAGGAEHERDPGVYHDTHTDAVPPAVLGLLERLCERRPQAAVMLERDGRYPPAAELRAELDSIADAARLPRATA